MKSLIKITSLLLLIYSCNSDNKLKDKQVSNLELADYEISSQEEKVALLASIKDVSFDTLNLILKDYYSKTSDYYSTNDSLAFIVDKTINSISKSYKMSKSTVASIIFSFKYEMQTKEDILDDIEQEMREHQDQESNDPRY
jgi:hypothetical protein